MNNKKNLIYIFADQWRAQAIGAAGEDHVSTPCMDGFARESFCMSSAVSTYPLCSPHRASLLTGKYPYRLGIWTNCKTGLDETVMLKAQETTITDVLWQEGYDTAYIGKWHLDASEKNFSKNPQSHAEGWDAYTPPGERRHHIRHWFSYGAMDEHLKPHYWKNDSRMIQYEGWSPAIETREAVSYLENRPKDKPFCLFLSWNPPHPPYGQLPDRLRSLYEGYHLQFRENVPEEWRRDPEFLQAYRDYFGAVSGLDEQFGTLMGWLKDNGLWENSIIVLSSDHGDCLGSHGLYGKNIWYEESIRIPFYIGGGGIVPGRSDYLFASQDHMPTLLELLQVPVPDTVDGRSAACVIRGEKPEDEPSEVFLCMIPGMPELVEEYRKLGLNNKAFGWRGLRTKDFTYVVDNGTCPGERQTRYLYDNRKDPWQMDPCILTLEEAEKWDQVLRGYLINTGDPFLL